MVMSNFPARAEVFVAGGGPAGLAAAIAARQAGFDVTLADHAQPPIDKACGEGIMPDGLAALRELGIVIGPGMTSPFRGIRFLDDSHHVEAAFSHGVGYGIRRTALHRVMADRAQQLGVRLLWNTRITGLSEHAIDLGGERLPYRWLICADGQNSRMRRLAGLERSRSGSQRYGFRRHYKVAHWADHVEVHWSDCGQMYVTPVANREICIAFITRHPGLRFDAALPAFPALTGRLRGVTPERDYLGSLTTTRKFAAVQSLNVALVGEASGSVDAVTGEGLSMAFREAQALAEAMQTGDLRGYESAHRAIARVPRLMSSLMLRMDRHPVLRRRVLRALSNDPACFAQMLAIHTGAASLGDFDMQLGFKLGWNLLAA